MVTWLDKFCPFVAVTFFVASSHDGSVTMASQSMATRAVFRESDVVDDSTILSPFSDDDDFRSTLLLCFVVALKAGLPDGIFSNQKYQFG
jgi:hypothetical protein